ncbi:MAG: DUF1385 domain-containing protein [Firmicutes bacterium]|nr:DUF1385 domain-containing protein [Bacillota bacterium]
MTRRDKYRGCPVIEGVLINDAEKKIVVCRNEFGDIVGRKLIKQADGDALPALPLLRGVVFFFREMAAFFSALLWSARQAGASEEENMGWGRFALGLLTAVLTCFFLYLLVPAILVTAVKLFFGKKLALAVNFAVKTALFFLLLLGLGRTEGVQRLQAYHGAAHKAIHAQMAAERGLKQAWEKLKAFSLIHNGCASGYVLSSLLYLVMAASFCIYLPALERILIELLLFVLIFGLNYEFFRRYWQGDGNSLWKTLTSPGSFLQKFTLREPQEPMLKIAAAALQQREESAGPAENGGQWAKEQLKTWVAEKPWRKKEKPQKEGETPGEKTAKTQEGQEISQEKPEEQTGEEAAKTSFMPSFLETFAAKQGAGETEPAAVSDRAVAVQADGTKGDGTKEPSSSSAKTAAVDTLRGWGKTAAGAASLAAVKIRRALTRAGAFLAEKGRVLAKALKAGAAAAGVRLAKFGQACKTAGAKGKSWLAETWQAGKAWLQPGGQDAGVAEKPDAKPAAASTAKKQAPEPKGKAAAAKPQGNKPQDSKAQGGKPQGNAHPGNKPQSGKPQGNAQPGNKPQSGKPQGNAQPGNKAKGGKPQGNAHPGNKPQSGKPQGNAQPGNKPQSGKPQGNAHPGNKPQGGKPQGHTAHSGKPQGNKAQGAKSQENKSSADKA